jgi:hypothetical protein
MKNILILLLISFLLFSCKEKIKQEIKIERDNSNIKLVFPDTVYINEGYDGEIKYKNHLDTITTTLDDVKKYRYIEYYFLKTKNINYDETYLKTIIKDTAYADNSKVIPLLYVKFDKLGQNYIDGIITDEVSILNGGKLVGGKPGTRIITNQFRVTKGVYVIEKPKKAK